MPLRPPRPLSKCKHTSFSLHSPPIFLRPFILKEITGIHNTYVILDNAGKVVAQGNRDLCDQVMQRGPF